LNPSAAIICETFRSVNRSFLKLFCEPGTPCFNPVEVDVKIAKTGAVTVRLDPKLKERLAQAATKLDLSENDIVRHALRAAVNAIEAQITKSSCRSRWRSENGQFNPAEPASASPRANTRNENTTERSRPKSTTVSGETM
jgi:predicted transcriptional regulator